MTKKKPERWWDCRFASFDVIRDASEGRFRHLVWPDEGEFDAEGAFIFNEAHQGFEPLFVDKVSADMMLAVFKAVAPARQKQLEEWIPKSRGHFGSFWELTQRCVTIKGFTSGSQRVH